VTFSDVLLNANPHEPRLLLPSPFHFSAPTTSQLSCLLFMSGPASASETAAAEAAAAVAAAAAAVAAAVAAPA
jgi:hypothetical protein